MNKFSWMIVWLLVCALVWFIFLNRAHTKIQQALIVAFAGILTVVLGIILFTTENTKIEKNISSVTFLSLEQKKPVFFTAPVLIHHFMHQGIIWGEFERDHPDEAKKLIGDFPKGEGNLKILQNLQAIFLMNYLKQSFINKWDILYTKKILPGSVTTIGRNLNTDPKDKRTITSKQLVEIFKQNRFCKSLQQRGDQVTLPKGTEIKYIPYSEENRTTQILISKKFAFEIKITFFQSSYSAGLGAVANYIGLTEPTNVWHVNWENRDKFGTAVVDINCEAEFFALKSGNPKVQRYKKWIKNLFDNIYEDFDWSVCNENMQKYNEELAHQKIVSGLGRGFEQPNKTNNQIGDIKC